jgi:hypothetical protein
VDRNKRKARGLWWLCLSTAMIGAALVPIPFWVLAQGGRADEYQRAQYLVLCFSGLVLFGSGLLAADGRLTALFIGIPVGIALGISPIGMLMQIVLDRWLGAAWRFGF